MGEYMVLGMQFRRSIDFEAEDAARYEGWKKGLDRFTDPARKQKETLQDYINTSSKLYENCHGDIPVQEAYKIGLLLTIEDFVEKAQDKQVPKEKVARCINNWFRYPQAIVSKVKQDDGLKERIIYYWEDPVKAGSIKNVMKDYLSRRGIKVDPALLNHAIKYFSERL